MNKKLLLLLTASTLLTAQTFAADATSGTINSDIKINIATKEAVSTDMKIMPYNPYEITQQRFIYTGELPTNFTGMEIYKGINNLVEDEKLKTMLKSLQLEDFDLSKLENMTLTNLAIKEKKDKGFRINLDFEGGYISVYKDYSSVAYQPNQQQKTFERLSDEQAIQIANDFINKFKINTKNYGTPYVEAAPMVMYKMTDSSNYVDPFVQVVFPSKIDGKNVNERYGQNAGLRISVSSETKSIEGFSVKIEKLEKTSETKLIDSNKLKSVIEKGGYDYDISYESGYTIKYQDIKLINPKVEYVKVDNYINGMNTYYAPAIVFETVKSDDPNIYVQDKVIVPLIDKAYENQ